MLQCKFANQEEEQGMKKGERSNECKKQCLIHKNGSDKARKSGLLIPDCVIKES